LCSILVATAKTRGCGQAERERTTKAVRLLLIRVAHDPIGNEQPWNLPSTHGWRTLLPGISHVPVYE
jgi:hypothetical protein